MDKQGKAQLRVEVAEKFKNAKGVILAEFRGMTVEELTQFRVQLRKANAEFKVVKNRIARKAIENEVQDMGVVAKRLKGPLGLVCAYGDAAQATKAVLEFQKDHPNLVVTGGYLDSSDMSVDDLKAVADLPPKEVLLGRIVGTLVAPHRGLLGVLNGVPRNLVQVINAIKEKKA